MNFVHEKLGYLRDSDFWTVVALGVGFFTFIFPVIFARILIGKNGTLTKWEKCGLAFTFLGFGIFWISLAVHESVLNINRRTVQDFDRLWSNIYWCGIGMHVAVTISIAGASLLYFGALRTIWNSRQQRYRSIFRNKA